MEPKGIEIQRHRLQVIKSKGMAQSNYYDILSITDKQNYHQVAYAFVSRVE